MIDLDKLERLEREATPGTWAIDDRGRVHAHFAVDLGEGMETTFSSLLLMVTSANRDGESNLDLLIALRNAAPAMIAELRAGRERIAELESPSKVDPDLLQMAMRIAAGHADASDAWALLTEVERLRRRVSEMGPSDA